MATKLFYLNIVIFTWKLTHAIYTCPPGEECFVDCENPQDPDMICNTNGQGVAIIDGGYATSLDIVCYQKEACQNIRIECPITSSDESLCQIDCSLDLSCENMEIYGRNSSQINLLCGANFDDREYPQDTVCRNVTIDGIHSEKGDSVPPKQTIAIECGDEGNAPVDTPACDLIMTTRLGEMDGVIPPSNITVQIACIINWAADEEVAICNRLYIDGGHSKYLNMYLEGDLTNSTINLTNTQYKVIIDINKVGTIWNSQINAPHVHEEFFINATAGLGFLDSTIIGPTFPTEASVNISTADRSGFYNSLFEGRFYMTGDGVFKDSTFNALGAGNVSITLSEGGEWDNSKLLIEDANASIFFFGPAKGYIEAVRSNQTSVACKAFDPLLSCNGLRWDLPPYVEIPGTGVKKQRAFLECVDYGCTNITTKSINGADDLGVTAVLCDCLKGGNGESGNSCIGVVNFACLDGTSHLEASFDGETCSGDEECCGAEGLLEQETRNALCYDNVDDGSSGLSDWEVAGVTIGVFFGLLLIASLVCYCQNQRTMRDHIKRATATNPYTQKLADDDNDEKKGNGVANAPSGGYGATQSSDMDAL